MNIPSKQLILSIIIGATMTTVNAQRELLWDMEHITEMTGGAKLTLHHPVFREVAIVHDAPWEGNVCCYHTVIQDGAKYMMYYRGMTWNMPGMPPHADVTCYAESDDGVHWRKPNLGIFEFNGSKENNIIWMGDASTHNFAPFLDTNPACQPEQRFKAIGGTDTKGLFLYVSPDGIHWKLAQPEPVFTKGLFDSQNTAFYDNVRNCYVLHFRDMQPIKNHFSVRAILRATSPDAIHWSEAEWLDYGPDAPPMELYTNAITPYVRQPEMYIGFPKRFLRNRTTVYDHSGGGGIPGLSDGVFMSSRDDLHYHRWSEAFVRPGLQHERWINRNNMAASGCVITRSDIPGTPDELSIYSTEAYYSDVPNRIRRLTMRMDGFVSVQAPYNGGAFTMKPITFKPTANPHAMPDCPVQLIDRPQGDRALKVSQPSVYTLPVEKNLGKQVTFAITIDNTQPGSPRRLFTSYAGGPNNAGEQKFVLDMQIGVEKSDWHVLRLWYDGMEIGVNAADCPDWKTLSRGRCAIVATYDDGVMKLYVNGKCLATGGKAGYGDLITPVGPIRFAEDYPPTATTNEPYLGEVLDMAIVQRVLTDAEIAKASAKNLSAVLSPETDKGLHYDMQNKNAWQLVNRLDPAQKPLDLNELRWGDTMLLLNASTSAAGDIRCEIRDEANQPIPGFTLSECMPLYGDDMELIMTWKNGPDITSLANRPVILHFELRDADIYSFRFGQP